MKARDYKIDGLKWLKDESLDEFDPDVEPPELAADAIADLQAAVEELNQIVALLETNGNKQRQRGGDCGRKEGMSTAPKTKIEEVETDTDTELPEEWAATVMGTIADVIGGGTPKSSETDNFSPSGYRWITPADLSTYDEIYISKGARSLSEKGLAS